MLKLSLSENGVHTSGVYCLVILVPFFAVILNSLKSMRIYS